MLRHIASSLDKIPAWFLCVGAPFFAAPIDSMMNLSLSTLVVPSKWKSASILLVAKSYVPLMPSDYQPISFTPVLFRVLEHIVVTEYTVTYGLVSRRQVTVSFQLHSILTMFLELAHRLFALRTVRHHGPPEDVTYAVYRAVVVAKLSCASPAW